MERNTSAKAAVEIAVYDLWGQLHGAPLYQMLGGGDPVITTDITISVDHIDKMVADSIAAVERGFDSLKIKVGKDIGLDIERVKAIHAAVEGRALLRLDANQGWTAKQAVYAMHALEDAGVLLELLEQLMKTGGISNAVRVADIAALYGVQCMIGCMLESAISVAAAVHLAVAKADAITKVDLDGPSLSQFNPVHGGVVFNESEITITDAPGLGIVRIDGLEPLPR